MMMAKIMLNTIKKWTTLINLKIGVWLTKLLH